MAPGRENTNSSLGRIAARLSRMADSYFQHRFRQYNIGPSQAKTLHYIIRNDGISQSALTRFLHIDKSSVTSQLAYLEKNGYIRRERAAEDKRKLRIRVTDKTRRIEASLRAAFASWTRVLLRDFDPRERRELFSLLDRVEANAQQKLQELRKDAETKKS
jgi:DNA-binding MarR family transcriptional regulator